MRHKIGKGEEEFLFQVDFWSFRQEFYIPESPDNEEYWDKLLEGGNFLYNKYKNTEIAEYVKDVIMACIRDLDRKATEKYGKPKNLQVD